MAGKGVIKFDWKLLVLMLTISAVSLVVLHSAGYDVDEEASGAFRAQGLNIIVGLVAFFTCVFIKTPFWKRWAFVIYIVGCVLLIMVLGIGVVAGGARRWLNLGFIRLQPSEIMKIGIILVMARVFSSEAIPRDGFRFTQLFYPLAVILFPAVLIVIQPDLGTAMSLCLVGGSMLLFAGIEKRTIITLVTLGIVVAVIGWFSFESLPLEEYQKQRVRTFLSPEVDPMGSGYHAIQSKIAVGSGGLSGKGYMKGTQTQLRFLPEQTTDFIFSVLAEEWGFIGSSLLIVLYGLIILRLLMIATRAQERYSAFLAFGAACYIFWHSFINIGMVIGVLPVVGITLPLVSYGGTSVISFMTAIGLAAGTTTKRSMFG